MGAMCKKGHRFLQDGETCTYCEAPPTGGQREYAVFNLDLGPVIKVPLEEVCEPLPPLSPRIFSYAFPQHGFPRSRRIGFSALSPAARLDAVQGMLRPKNSLGEPLPLLCTVDEAKQLLDIPSIPLQWQDRAGFNLHCIPVVVSQNHRGPPTIICSPEDFRALRLEPDPEKPLAFSEELKKIEDVLLEHIEKMKTYAFHASPAAAMETTPPLQTEDAHGDQKGTRSRPTTR